MTPSTNKYREVRCGYMGSDVLCWTVVVVYKWTFLHACSCQVFTFNKQVGTMGKIRTHFEEKNDDTTVIGVFFYLCDHWLQDFYVVSYSVSLISILSIIVTTLNESYNLPPYILAASSDNKSKASTNFSFIQRVKSCQNSSSNFISIRPLLLE